MAASVRVTKTKDLKQRWGQLELKRSSILSLARDYSAWTLPTLIPRDSVQNMELQVSNDSIGAQAVNHLSNRVVTTLFPPQSMFFRLHVPEEMKQMATAAIMQQAQSPDAAASQVAQAMAIMEEQLASTEKKAQDYMDFVAYRPVAIHAAKLLIVSGNALMFHPEGKAVQCYSINDYCICRDISGGLVELMTREIKSFATFAPAIQAALRNDRSNNIDDDSDVEIYTLVRLEDDGRYYVYQQANNTMLDTTGNVWTKETLPWIPLVWNLARGEDYGRGLVAEYAGAFHGVNTLSRALLNIAAVMSDIKWLVNPLSQLNVVELNKAATGTYHPGKEGDVTPIQMDKQSDAQFISSMIERYERQIAQAFLLNSQLTRQAERVTAEEIRMSANELETSNGGIYSRLAHMWQQPTANIVLDQIKFDGLQAGIKPKIITGMDSLSRAGELDNLRMFMADLGMLNTVPEDVRAAMKMPDFMRVIGTNRQVDYKQFTKTNEEMQAEAAAMQQQQQDLIAQEGQNGAMAEASKQAMREE